MPSSKAVVIASISGVLSFPVQFDRSHLSMNQHAAEISLLSSDQRAMKNNLTHIFTLRNQWTGMKMVPTLAHTETRMATMAAAAAVGEAVLETAHLPVRDKETVRGLVLDQGLVVNVIHVLGNVKACKISKSQSLIYFIQEWRSR